MSILNSKQYVPTVSGFFYTVVGPAIRKTPDAFREVAFSMQNAVKSFFAAPPKEKMVQIGKCSLFVGGIFLGTYVSGKMLGGIEACFPNHPTLAKGAIFPVSVVVLQSITKKDETKPSHEQSLQKKKIERLS